VKKTLIIAEIAQAHDGSLGILHSYIDALAETGVDVVKFQTHIAEAESSSFEPFRVNFSYVDKTRFDYWKRMGFTEEQWAGIKAHCEEKGMEFMSSPFSVEAVELLERLQVKRYKIGSGEVSNLLMLEHIARTGKPIILSSGMSSYAELDYTIDFLKTKNAELSLLQCNTEYPTPPERVGIQAMLEMKQRYQIPVGLSDHSATLAAPLCAVSLGAEILEFHVVFDRRMFGPDAASSLEIDEVKQLVQAVRQVEVMRDTHVDKNDVERFSTAKVIFGKALAVRSNLPAGHQIKFEDLETKKPANQGIPASQFQTIIGRTLKHPLSAQSFLNFEDLVE
jgi:N-acetylneuraminate synthase